MEEGEREEQGDLRRYQKPEAEVDVHHVVGEVDLDRSYGRGHGQLHSFENLCDDLDQFQRLQLELDGRNELGPP